MSIIYATRKYAFHQMRKGAAIVRKKNNSSVYFHPEVVHKALDHVKACYAHEEMFKGEHEKVFNVWCDAYFA